MNIQDELIVTKERVSELQKQVQELIVSKKQYDSVLNNVKEIIFQTDKEGLLTYINRTWVEVMGYSLEESIGISFSDFIHQKDRELIHQNFEKLIKGKIEYYKQVVTYVTKDGGFKWIEIYAALTLDENNNILGSSGTLNDVTERVLMEQELVSHKEHLEKLIKDKTRKLNDTNKKLSYCTTHDSLTKLSRRYHLEEGLHECIKRAKFENISSALLSIDLDNFKIINDTYGHSVGDEVLIKLADLLRNTVESDDIIARLGGDEFAILLNGTTFEKAVEIGESLREEIEKINIGISSGIVVNITVSMGIVKIDDSLTIQEILACAGNALSSSKDNGKNRVTVLKNNDDKAKIYEFNKIVRLIKRAIQYDKFILYYQPIIKVRGRILHYEALIRMIDEEENIIPPGQFIPVAEQCGLMAQIDKWVVKDVLKTLEENPHISVFINLSGLSLGDKALLSFIEESISNSKIEPAQLGFEITETSAIKDLSQSQKWIRRLKELGCKFALDDFGVGFSSFTYLGNLPVDYLKIDGSFVKTLDKDPTQKALIQAMNAVAHVLGKQTIAEFVENREILKILQELNVDCGQGYYIGKPQLMG